jgi:hypothetical protein
VEGHCPAFSRFLSLPAELRIQVWNHAIPNEPRIISIGPSPGAPDESDFYADLELEDPPPHVAFFDRKIQQPSTDIINACCEARELVLKKHEPLFPQDMDYPLISANLATDIIHFGPHFELWQLKAFAKAIGPEKAKQIRTLALEYRVDYHDPIFATCYALRRALRIRLLFEQVEKLILIPHGPGEGLERKGGWNFEDIIPEPGHWERIGEEGDIFACFQIAKISVGFCLKIQDRKAAEKASRLDSGMGAF